MPRSQTLTFTSATQQTTESFGLNLGMGGLANVAMSIAPSGCAVTGCILQIQPVGGADWSDFIGGSSSVDWASTTSPRLRDVSSTLPSDVADAGAAWASIDLSGFYAARLKVTTGGAGSVAVRFT
jgi:hypothetical protein